MNFLPSPLRQNKQESGFTLVELLVVILIIGVLAAIAIPAFMNQRERANVAALESDMKSVALAMETWLSNPKNKASDLPTTPGEGGGWNVILRYDDTSTFPGDYTWSLDANNEPLGPLSSLDPLNVFSHIHLSEGVGIGIVTKPSTLGVHYGTNGYCLVGGVKDSPYAVVRREEGKNDYEYALFYDPIAGGLHTPETLPAGGACDNYYNRIHASGS